MTQPISKRNAWIVFCVLVAVLLAGTTMPAALKNEIEGQMWRRLPWSMLAHYTLFTLIALCPVYGFGRAAVWRTLAVALFLAVLTETLQSFVPGRVPTLRDVCIDLGGTMTALAFYAWSARRQSAA